MYRRTILPHLMAAWAVLTVSAISDTILYAKGLTHMAFFPPLAIAEFAALLVPFVFAIRTVRHRV